MAGQDLGDLGVHAAGRQHTDELPACGVEVEKPAGVILVRLSRALPVAAHHLCGGPMPRTGPEVLVPRPVRNELAASISATSGRRGCTSLRALRDGGLDRYAGRISK